MSRRKVMLAVTAGAAMVALAALSLQKKDEGFPLLDWANKGKADAPPKAVLIELGVKDMRTADWSGKVEVAGAKVVRSEGYRFREEDKLVTPTQWTAKSHLPLRLPQRNPALVSLDKIATVGLVLYLDEPTPDATLNIEAGADKLKATVPLRDVLAGKSQPILDGKGVVRLITSTTRLSEGPTEDDFPAAAHGPDGTLWLAHVRYHIVDPERRIESKPYDKQPENFKDLYTPEFRDEVVLRSFKAGKWGEPMALTGANEDIVRCAVAVAGDGDVWVFYSAQRQGKYHIFARPVSKKFSPEATANPAPRPGPEMRITQGDGPNLTPVACTDSKGVVHVAFQSWSPDAGRFVVRWLRQDGDKFVPVQILPSQANQWSPYLAAGPNEATACALDTYAKGDYDTQVFLTGKDKPGVNVASTLRFEARPAMVFDTKGRLWIAYEEGPEKWAKDYGAQDSGDGNSIYNQRSVRVVCLDEGKLMRPVAELPTNPVEPPSLPFDRNKGNHFERAERYSNPRLGLDGKGRLWLTYRVKFGSRYSSHPGSYWLSYARMLQGDTWSEPIELHYSDGLLDHRPVLVPHPAGGLHIIHNGDGRYSLPNDIHNRIYSSYIDLPGEPVEPKLVPHEAGTKPDDAGKRDQQMVEQIRRYRIKAGGKEYRLLRGEFHRHTEVSWDGGPDGSLEDMFRYAIDSAGMDWIGNGDHDNGAGREYCWWLTQKLTDAYHVPARFTPMFTYERSVSYPHGHRNCMFDKRGVRTLPRLAEPDADMRVAGIHADDTKMLYRYLHELDGICAIHTSATGMGTDWRDNDPKVEPIVEIYQGDRMSYEIQEAPRAGYDPTSGKEPANVGGWRPAGFINNALERGYRLAFQSSSDHWSTHISYCIVLAEKFDRKGILDAVKKRHCYGATDDIVVNVRSGQHIMGDEFTTTSPPKLEIDILGTGPLARIDILKNSKVVDTITPEGAAYSGTWTDPAPEAGVHYYYVRVLQKDNEIAWGSPMWIEYRK